MKGVLALYQKDDALLHRAQGVTQQVEEYEHICMLWLLYSLNFNCTPEVWEIVDMSSIIIKTLNEGTYFCSHLPFQRNDAGPTRYQDTYVGFPLVLIHLCVPCQVVEH